MAEVAQPEHGEHEVDVVGIEKRGQMNQYDGNQGGEPYVGEKFDKYPSDEVTEENALQEPHRIHESEPAEVHQFGTRIVTGSMDKQIHH